MQLEFITQPNQPDDCQYHWFNGSFRWGSWFLGEGGLHDYSPLGERVGFWVTSHWGSWFNGYFPLGKLVSGLLPAGGEGGLHDYSPLGERGFWVMSHGGSLFTGYFPLGKLVLGLFPAGREGGLHDYSPLGERGFLVTSHWGSWVSGLLPNGEEGGLHDYSTLGERVGFYDHFSQGMLGFIVTSERKKGERGNISKRSRKEQRKARLNLYNYVLFILSVLVPAVGEGGLLGYSLLGERVGFYGYFPWRCWFLVTS